MTVKGDRLAARGVAVALAFQLVGATTSSVAAQTVINVPPDPAPRSVLGDTVLNLMEGGTLPSLFDAEAGATVNLRGGNASFGFSAQDASLVNVSAGFVDGL